MDGSGEWTGAHLIFEVFLGFFSVSGAPFVPAGAAVPLSGLRQRRAERGVARRGVGAAGSDLQRRRRRGRRRERVLHGALRHADHVRRHAARGRRRAARPVHVAHRLHGRRPLPAARRPRRRPPTPRPSPSTFLLLFCSVSLRENCFQSWRGNGFSSN